MPHFLHKRFAGALPKQTQLKLAHRAFEAEEESVVNQARIIDPVVIDQDRLGHAAQINEVMPVAIVAGEARRLQGKHGAHGPFTHGGEQPAEARTRLPPCAAHAEIVVNHDDAREAHLPRAIGEAVLALLAFAVMAHLLETRLTDIDVRGSLKMVGTNFLVHRRSL